jgi:hypothetical protein
MSGTKETRYAIHFKGSYISNLRRNKGQTFEVDGYYPTNTSPNREVKFTNDLAKAKTWKTLATVKKRGAEGPSLAVSVPGRNCGRS